MLIFINKHLPLHEQLKNEDIKDEDIDLMEEYLESRNELESKLELSKININTVLQYLKENKLVETHKKLGVN